jgi:hypothetical protein
VVLNLDISLGNLLTIASFAGGGLWFIVRLQAAIDTMATRFDVMAVRLTSVETEIKKLTDILVTLGRYEERFLRLEREIDDLRHGRGFITNHQGQSGAGPLSQRP